MDNVLPLDQIADAINRAKLGNQKHKNEMMRLGTSDPTSFKSQFATQLSEQQQPSEFWGAGRKLAQNQNPDQEINDYVGDALPTLGGQRYYYGNVDYSVPENIQSSITNAGFKPTTSSINPTLYNLFGNNTPITKFRNQEYYKGDIDPSRGQIGTQGYNQQDLGGGKYNILDTTGNSLGIGYKGLEDAIKEINKVNNPNPPNWDAIHTNSRMLRPFPDVYSNKSPYSAGDLDKWEVLGQVLSGYAIPHNPTSNRPSIALSGNGIPEQISGLNTLFGSQPVIYNNELKGYIMDPTPADESMVGYKDPYTVLREDKSGNTRSAYGLQRQYNDIDTWKRLTTNIDPNQLYVSKENAGNLPGWTNNDISQYHHQSGGMFPQIAQGLGALLQFTPFAPAGLALSTLSSLSQGNHLGGMLGAITGGLGQAGVFDKLGNSLGESLGLGKDVGKYFVKGGLGSLSTLAQGGDFKQALLSGLGSGIGDYAGENVTGGLSDILGKTGSKIAGAGVSGALKSLFKNGNPIEGAISGGLSSGLGDFLSTMTNNTGENVDSRRAQSYNNLGKVITNIARQQYKRRR